MSKTKVTPEQKEDSLKYLMGLIVPNSYVFGMATDSNTKGTERSIHVLIPSTDGNGYPTIKDVSAYVAEVLDYEYNPNLGMRVKGGGQDLRFAVIYRLSQVMYGSTYILNAVGL